MKVSVKCKCVAHEEEREEGQFGAWSVHREYKIDGIVPDGASKWEIHDDANEAYVVYACYASGDTFGRSTGNLAILAIFGRRKHAEAVAELVEKTISGGKYVQTIEYNGQTINVNILTGCYFTQCEEVTVEKFNVIRSRNVLSVIKSFFQS